MENTLPWHTVLNKDGSCSVRDRYANLVALLPDPRAADFILDAFNRIETLNEEIEQKCGENENLSDELFQTRSKLDEVETDLEIANTKLEAITATLNET